MEWNCMVRYFAEFLGLFLLNAHFEDLSFGRCVDKKLAYLLHSCDLEVGLSVLLLQVLVPTHFVRIYGHWQVALKQLIGVSQLICCLVITEAARTVCDYEVLSFYSEDVLYFEGMGRRVGKHELEVALFIAEKNLAPICAHYQVVFNPGVASIVCRIHVVVFFGKLVAPLHELTIIHQFVVFVAVVTKHQQGTLTVLSDVIWVE